MGCLRLLVVCLLSACYLSHPVGGSEGRDASVSDAADPRGDSTTPRRDALFRDASTRDTDSADAFVRSDALTSIDSSRRDASVGEYIRASDCMSEEYLGEGRGVLEWPSVDCGHVSDVQVVALEDGRMLAVATESRGCDDRPGLVLAQYFTAARGRYVGSEELPIGVARGPAYADAFGNEVAICSGDELHILGGESVLTTRAIPALAGCPSAGSCGGIAHDGDGWVLIVDAPDCPAGRAEIVRVDAEGELRGASAPTPAPLRGVSSAPWGAAVIGAPVGRSANFYSWTPPESAPDISTVGVRANARVSGIGPWPYQDGAWALVFAEPEGIQLQVIDRHGAVLLDRFRSFDRGAPVSVDIQPTTFGLMVAVSYDPESEAGGEYITYHLNEAGDYFRDAAVEFTNGPSGRLLIDQMWNAPAYIFHRLSQPGNPTNSTEVIGIRCGD